MGFIPAKIGMTQNSRKEVETMKFIGITGGVGAGKSKVLSYLKEKPGVRVLLADEIAHDLMKPDTACYEMIREAFADEDIFLPEGGLRREALAQVIFADEEKRQRMNAIVHPAVRDFVCRLAEAERARGELWLLVLEAALLIEEHYDEICDELWYIYTREDIRRERLAESRGYTPQKTDRIFASQLDEAAFRRHCVRVIDNNGTEEETRRQLDGILEIIAEK